jgi:hypothetical protein
LTDCDPSIRWQVLRDLTVEISCCERTSTVTVTVQPLEQMVADGRLGVATGQGFQVWAQQTVAALQGRRQAFLTLLARAWFDADPGAGTGSCAPNHDRATRGDRWIG